MIIRTIELPTLLLIALMVLCGLAGYVIGVPAGIKRAAKIRRRAKELVAEGPCICRPGSPDWSAPTHVSSEVVAVSDEGVRVECRDCAYYWEVEA